MWDKNVREFFDARAALWDEKMVINEEAIRIILDKAGVEKGKDILDVACGTGVMIPFYLQRDVSSIDGIDISPEMVKIAKEKFPEVCKKAAYLVQKNAVCALVSSGTL